jgi:hypothetical protein
MAVLALSKTLLAIFVEPDFFALVFKLKNM